VDLTSDDDLRGRSVRGVAWVAADKWTNRLLNFAVLIILARLLSPTDFGTVALANVFIAILAVLAGLGFDSYLVRAARVDMRTCSTALWISLALALVEYGALAAAAPWLADVLDAPNLPPLLWTVGAILPISALAAIPSALLRRDLVMKPLAVRGVLSSLIGGVGAVVLAILGAGAWALVFQLLAGQVVSCVLLYALTSWRPRLVFARTEARSMVRFGAAVVGTQLIHQLRDRGDELLIGGLLGPQALGFWTIATRLLRTGLDLFTSVVTTVSLSSFAKVSHDRMRFVGAIRTALATTAAVVIPGLAALAVLTPVLVPFAFGEKWQGSVVPAQLLTAAGIVGALQWVDANVWWALGRSGVELGLAALISTIHLATVALSAPYGLDVVALAILIRAVALAPIRVLALNRWAQIPLSIYRPVWRIAVCVLGMVAAIVGLSLPVDGLPALAYLAIIGGVALVVYLGLSMLLSRTLMLDLVRDVRSLRG
jgi:O-antigen/teichoic acid export membrane protein